MNIKELFLPDRRYYLLRIRLLHIEPEIWRRFVVPADITLDRLHDVIQIVLGWLDYHLHEFIIGRQKYTENPEMKEDGREDGRYRLVDLIKRKGRSFTYIYDFGDYWEHEITIEDNCYVDNELESEVQCLEGEGACPPEDVGGTGGFYEFCLAMADPGHERHEEYRTWYDGEFRREHFDVFEVNYELMKYLRWSRDRERPWGPWHDY